MMGGHGGMPPHPSGVAPPHQQSPRQQPQPIPGTHNNIFVLLLSLCVCTVFSLEFFLEIYMCIGDGVFWEESTIIPKLLSSTYFTIKGIFAEALEYVLKVCWGEHWYNMCSRYVIL